MILTRPKQIGPVQNDLDSPKSFWTHRRTRYKSAHKNMLAHVCLFIYLFIQLKFIHSEKTTKMRQNVHLFLKNTQQSQKSLETVIFWGLSRIYDLLLKCPISPDLFTRLFHLACTSMDDHSLKNPVHFTNSFIHLRVQQGEIFHLFQFYWLLIRLETTQKCRVKSDIQK